MGTVGAFWTWSFTALWAGAQTRKSTPLAVTWAPTGGSCAAGDEEGGGSEALTAPMQGKIVKVLVDQGDEVEVGQPILVLEAMKMENSILSHTAGTVEELKVEAGAAVDTGAVLAVIR